MWLDKLIALWAETRHRQARCSSYRDFRRRYPTEPQFQGRGLDSWLEDYFLKDGIASGTALTVIGQMGAEATPHLLALVRYLHVADEFAELHLRTIEAEIQAMAAGMKRDGGKSEQCEVEAHLATNEPPVPLDRPANGHNAAPNPGAEEGCSLSRFEFRLARLFGKLRSDAIRFIPELSTELRQYGNHAEAASALAGMGKEAIGPLLEALNHECKFIRASAANAMEALDQGVEAILPSLLRCCTDPAPMVRAAAIWTTRFHVRTGHVPFTDEILRALISCVEDLDENVRIYSILLLAEGGAKAKAAVPALRRASSDASSRVRSAAWCALDCIPLH